MRNIDLFDDYLTGRLNDTERKDFESRLQADASFKEEFNKHAAFVKVLQKSAHTKAFRNKLKALHTTEFGAANVKHINQNKTFYEKYIKPTGFAASVAVIAVILTITALSTGGYLIKKQNSEYQKLSNKVDVLETKQDAIISGFNKANNKKKKIYAPANTTGTGFAINSKGYFVTCLHVVKGNDSVFIANKNLERIGARVVYMDNKTDIAILKIDSIALNKWKDLPYNFKTTESELAEKAFTLGYPAQDIVYGEGSISSSSALGDTAMYQVSIPVNNGNSGGPLVDEKGNIIGIINGKRTNAEGTGFATKSICLSEMIKSIEDPDLRKELALSKRNSLGGLKRSEQVKRMSPFIFNVYVYKAN